jgi:hypothetical protein
MLALNPSTNSESPAWERQEGENDLWYFRFRRYLAMGTTRSVMGAFNAERVEQGKAKEPRPSGAWTKAAERFAWRERAAAYDAHQIAQSEAAREEERRREEQEWDRRERALCERAFNVAERMIEKAEGMLAFPLIERTIEEKKEKLIDSAGEEMEVVVATTILRPGRWTFGTAPRLVAGADLIARLACDLRMVEMLKEIEALSDEQLSEEFRAQVALADYTEGEIVGETADAPAPPDETIKLSTS